MDVFNTKDRSWTQVLDMPSAISHFNTVLDGRTVWIAGGAKTGGQPKVKEPSPYASGVGHPIREVWNYDFDRDRYNAAPLLPGPRGAKTIPSTPTQQWRHDHEPA